MYRISVHVPNQSKYTTICMYVCMYVCQALSSDVNNQEAQEIKAEFQKKWREAMDAKRSNQTTANPCQHASAGVLPITRDPHEFASKWLQDMTEAVNVAARSSLPKKKPMKIPSRGTSVKTMELFEVRSKMTKQNSTKTEFSEMQQKIKSACLEDYKGWVSDCVKEMENAEKAKNTSKIFKVVKKTGRQAQAARSKPHH